MFQGCITASGTGQLAVIGSIRNFSLYQKVKSRLKIVLNIVYETRRARKPRHKIMRVLRRIDLFIFLLYKL